VQGRAPICFQDPVWIDSPNAAKTRLGWRPRGPQPHCCWSILKGEQRWTWTHQHLPVFVQATSPRHWTEATFLGLEGGRAHFALAAEALDADRRAGPWTWAGLREVANQLAVFEAGLFAYAKALLLWQTRARFCPACGTPTQVRRAGHSTRCSNADCGLEQFPRTDAAIIVLVTDGPRALIGRQAGWPPKRYSTLAGFVEPGESLEDALRREVHEESGVRVGDCQYQSSQPWPFPASLMLGFRAQALDPTITLGDELEDVRWISASDLLDEVESGSLRMPFSISVSFRLLADWLLESANPDRVRTLLPGA